MNDKKLIDSLRKYAKSYIDGTPYNLNPGLALMIADRLEQLISVSPKRNWINVKSKFNIGDTVWVADYYYDDWFISNEDGYLICGIEAYINENTQHVNYVIKDITNNTISKQPSHHCFGSYDECKQWCDKENKQ